MGIIVGLVLFVIIGSMVFISMKKDNDPKEYETDESVPLIKYKSLRGHINFLRILGFIPGLITGFSAGAAFYHLTKPKYKDPTDVSVFSIIIGLIVLLYTCHYLRAKADFYQTQIDIVENTTPKKVKTAKKRS